MKQGNRARKIKKKKSDRRAIFPTIQLTARSPVVRRLICKTARMGRAGSPLHHTSVRRVRSFTLPRDYNCKSVHSSFFRLHSCCLPGPAHVTRPSPHYRHYPPGHTTHYSAMTLANGSTDLKNGSPSLHLKGQSNKRVCAKAQATGHARESLVHVWSKGVCPVAVEGWTPPSLSWDSRPWVLSGKGEGGVQVGGGGCPCHCVPLGCPGVAETHLRDAPATHPPRPPSPIPRTPNPRRSPPRPRPRLSPRAF